MYLVERTGTSEIVKQNISMLTIFKSFLLFVQVYVCVWVSVSVFYNRKASSRGKKK